MDDATTRWSAFQVITEYSVIMRCNYVGVLNTVYCDHIDFRGTVLIV